MVASSDTNFASPDRPFDNIINFRDVGASINALCGSRILKEGVLFRSARLDNASERDKRRLVNELRISAVIDLRSSTEHQMVLDKASSELDSPVSDQPSPPAGPWRIFPISLTGKSLERALIGRLDWLTYLKVISLATLGYRSSAVHLVCSTAMRPRGLIGLAEDTLEHSPDEIRLVFDVLADDASYPVLVHCTQGKDRTGLVVLLLLLLMGSVPSGAISGDYAKSEGELAVEYEERIEEIRQVGLDEEFARCPDGFTEAVTEYLEKSYGGVRGYLESLGIDDEKLELIRKRLLV